MAGKIPVELVEEVGLYVSERKVYPREQDGRFQRLRKAAVIWLLGMYYAFAWLQWDDRQAVLFDLPARKFYVFGLSFWPQDFFYLALLLIIAGLTLFFFTALAGRLWCGYACPQTVWTEVFIWMERWTEGDRNKRMKLDAGPWNRDKVQRKIAKHFLWLVFALWTGLTFVGYFTPIRDLAARLVPFEWGGWEVFWVLFYALATWGNAGVLREQVCKYMCPYARFQSAMFDRNTLIIAYDPMRGEPRGARKKNQLASVLERARGLLGMDVATSAVVNAAQHRSAADLKMGARATTGLVVDAQEGLPPPPVVNSPEDLGDCIDCTICVQVCPTGIDIRNGLQYECIACGACVDACDSVMDKMGYPRGLIRNTTQNARRPALEDAAPANPRVRHAAAVPHHRLGAGHRHPHAAAGGRDARPQRALSHGPGRQHRERVHASHRQQGHEPARVQHPRRGRARHHAGRVRRHPRGRRRGSADRAGHPGRAGRPGQGPDGRALRGDD
jgi:polyferredoxin